MGSSNNRNRTASFPNGEQTIGHPSICPKCGVAFPPSITYNIVTHFIFSWNYIFSFVLIIIKL